MGFIDQFHFLFGIAIVHKHITVRQGVAMNRMWIGLFAIRSVVLVFQLLYGFDSCTRDGLIG